VLQAGRRRASLIETAGAGYRLRPCDDFDLTRFTEAARQATAARADGDPAAACDGYGQALTVWRGDPLGDIDILRHHPAVLALRRERAALIVDYADAACDLNDPGRPLPFLRELAAADPLDERVHARLMIALASCGQQAAALALYDQISRQLDHDLGVLPGAELTTAHQRILHQDLPTAPAAPATPAAPAGAGQAAAPAWLTVPARRVRTPARPALSLCRSRLYLAPPSSPGATARRA
jgi:DNA-binding SARP family transcriptional activator